MTRTSPKLPRSLATLFAGSVHVCECGPRGKTDEEIWEYARGNGFAIVSKDADFQQRSLLYGFPPKLIWLRLGNCTRQQLVQLITSHEQDIHALDADPFASMLVLSQQESV